jgi:phage baseplate assembly protein W
MSTDTATTLLVTRTYSDLDLSLQKNPNTKDIVIKKGADAVKRSVSNLVKTMFYERPYHPEIGCNVYRRLFDLLGDDTGTFEIQQDIERVINNFEPRVTLINVTVTQLSTQDGFQADISFSVQNIAVPISLTLYLRRTR